MKGKKEKKNEGTRGCGVLQWFDIFNWIQANSDIEVSFLRLRLPTILVVSYEIQVLVQFQTGFELEAVKFQNENVQNKNEGV